MVDILQTILYVVGILVYILLAVAIVYMIKGNRKSEKYWDYKLAELEQELKVICGDVCEYGDSEN